MDLNRLSEIEALAEDAKRVAVSSPAWMVGGTWMTAPEIMLSLAAEVRRLQAQNDEMYRDLRRANERSMRGG